MQNPKTYNTRLC